MTTRRNFAASFLGAALAVGFGATVSAQPLPPPARLGAAAAPPPRNRSTASPRKRHVGPRPLELVPRPL
ncbi:MAG TPA: hypothetical protein VEQ16_03090 [Acidocella sp.]|jgi:hypothetical protein|nr:hypothetical protein [Acidocella sp.]